jgi:hypothetical protein
MTDEQRLDEWLRSHPSSKEHHRRITELERWVKGHDERHRLDEVNVAVMQRDLETLKGLLDQAITASRESAEASKAAASDARMTIRNVRTVVSTVSAVVAIGVVVLDAFGITPFTAIRLLIEHGLVNWG